MPESEGGIYKLGARHHPSCVFLIGRVSITSAFQSAVSKLVLRYSFGWKGNQTQDPCGSRVAPWGVVSIGPLGYQEGFSFMGRKMAPLGKPGMGFLL